MEVKILFVFFFVALPYSTPCPLVTYSSENVKGYQGLTIRVENGFLNSMKKIDVAARECGVTVYVTQAFRHDRGPVDGAIAPAARHSNHLVGHAIDVNVEADGEWCNSVCLRRNENANARCFIEQVKAFGLRWGISWNDPVYIDDGSTYTRNILTYNLLYNSLQRSCR